jgi:hypothetical protein
LPDCALATKTRSGRLDGVSMSDALLARISLSRTTLGIKRGPESNNTVVYVLKKLGKCTAGGAEWRLILS